MFHPSSSAPSLLLPHFQLDWSAVSDIFSSVSRPKIAVYAHSDNGDEEFGYLAKSAHLTGYEPKQPDKMITADDDATPINDPDNDSISDFPKTTHENTDGSVFLQCVKPPLRRFLEVTLLFRKKAKKV